MTTTIIGERWAIVRGTEPGTLDNRPDRWYLEDLECGKRAAGGYSTKHEAIDVAEQIVMAGYGKGGIRW